MSVTKEEVANMRLEWGPLGERYFGHDGAKTVYRDETPCSGKKQCAFKAKWRVAIGGGAMHFDMCGRCSKKAQSRMPLPARPKAKRRRNATVAVEKQSKRQKKEGK